MQISLGTAIYISVKPIIKIYLNIGLGALMAYMNVLTVETGRNISDMVLTFILPCLIFNKVVSNISGSDIKTIGVIILTGLMYTVLGTVAALIVKLTCKVPRTWFGGLVAAGTWNNTSDLPIAYIQTLAGGLLFTEAEGNKGIAYVTMFVIVFTFTMFNMGGFTLIEADFKCKDASQESINDNEKAETAKNPARSDEESAAGLPEQPSERPSAFKRAALFPATLALCRVKSLNNGLNNLFHPPAQTDESISETPPDSEVPVNGNPVGFEGPTSNNPAEFEGPTSDTPTDFGGPNPASDKSASPTSPASSASSSASESLPEPTPIHAVSTSSLRRRIMPENPTGALDLHRSVSARSARSAFSAFSGTSTFSAASSCRSLPRTLELRQMPTQTIQDVINEYSEAHRIRTGQPGPPLDKRMTQEVGVTAEDITHPSDLIPPTTPKVLRIALFVLKNFRRPPSLALIVSLVVAMIPWVRGLFVNNHSGMPDAPDKLPILNFVIDFTSFIGAASVPFGLMLLGATIARLRLQSLPKNFIYTTLALTVMKLVVIPIISILWIVKLQKMRWIDPDDDIIVLVMAVASAVPTATTQVYFTAFYTPPEGPYLEMDCLSICLLVQYPALVISMPVLVTYVLKNVVGD